jgi:hypothetical protein
MPVHHGARLGPQEFGRLCGATLRIVLLVGAALNAGRAAQTARSGAPATAILSAVPPDSAVTQPARPPA